MAVRNFLDKDGLELYDELIKREIDAVKASNFTAEDREKFDGISEEANKVSYNQTLTSGTKIGELSIDDNSPINLYAPTPTSESDIAGMGFTKNAGTITGISMNGASVGTSGIVNLGTVITEHQDISGKQNASTAVKYGGNAAVGSAVKGVYIDSEGNATAMTYELNKTVPADAKFTDTTYENKTAVSGGTDVSLVTTGEKYIWNNKVDKNGTDSLMTAAEHTKLEGIATGAEVNVQSDWNQTTTTADDYIKNKPALGTAAAKNVPSTGNAAATEVVLGSDSRLTDARTPKSHTHTKSEITDFPTALSSFTDDSTHRLVTDAEKTAWDAKSEFSGSYNDLTNKPTIPTVNNKTLTIQKNGTNVATFTANSATDVTANISVPTKVSDLNNDSGFTTNTGTVTKVSTGAGLTGGDITTTGTIKANLKSETQSTLEAANKGSTSDREYAVGLDKNGKLSVNVPWTDNNTTYTAATAAPGNVASSSAVGTSTNYARQDHTHGITVTTGDANGQVKIAGINASVKGLGSAAYTNSNAYIAASAKGAASGVAELDSGGKVPSSQLPSFVDDVLEYNSLSAFPSTGETGKIYVAKDTNKTYRWSGTTYVEISPSLALGETSSTAYRGDRGKTAYDHASAKGSAFSSGLYKITTNAEGHVTAATAVAKSDITALGIPASNTNTTYTLTQDSNDGHKFTFAGSDGTSVTITIPDNNTTYTLSSLGIGNVKNYDQSKAIKSITRSGTTFTYTCLDNTTGTFTQQDNNTWTAMVGATSSANGTAGYVPAPPKDGYNTKYLRADGTWSVPAYPTVNNATLTIQKNGTNVQTFTANQSTNATANITVPTKVSELTNDSGFTTNTGTITGIKMNGASKGTSGVVDLGTVITAHQDISGKVSKTGDTMTGALNFANATANKAGDDVQIGDFNRAGSLGVQGINGNTAITLIKNGTSWAAASESCSIVYNSTNKCIDFVFT